MNAAKKAILIALIISVFLLIVKFGAFFYTKSNAILTDALESIVNVIASAFAFYSIQLASRPKDQNHPYGHGKVEFFSVFIEGTLIMIAGLLIVIKSVYNIFFEENVIRGIKEGAILMGFTGIINFLLSVYLIKIGKKLHSLTLQADGKHILTDAISSAGLMFAMLAIYFTNFWMLDNIIALLLSSYIVYTGYVLLRKSIAGLMDESDPETVNEMLEILTKYRKVEWIDVHNLRIQQYGAYLHIDCHLTLPFYFDLEKVHEELVFIENVVNKEREHAVEFFIHTDPCLPNCCTYCSIINCDSRKYKFEKTIEWTKENITKNQKHF